MTRFAGVLLAALLSGCASLDRAPVVAYAIVDPGATPPPAWLVFDGSIFVAQGSVGGEAAVIAKESGWPIFGPIATEAGRVVIYRRDPEERLELAPGDPLPAWAAEVFPAGLAGRLGVTFGE